MNVFKGSNFTFKFANNIVDEPNFIVEESEDWIENTIIKKGNWDIDTINLAKNFIEHDSTILDLGTNVGTFIVTLAKLYKYCTFIGVEAQKQKFIQLCANLYINNIKNVYPYMGAVTDKLNEKYLTMCIAKNNNNGASRLQCEEIKTRGNTDISHEEKVKALTLDTMDIQGKVTLIKIDVEGHEFNALLGGVELIKKHLPTIIFESWDHIIHKKPQLFKFFQLHNYCIYRIKHSDYIAVHKTKINNYTCLDKLQVIAR